MLVCLGSRSYDILAQGDYSYSTVVEFTYLAGSSGLERVSFFAVTVVKGIDVTFLLWSFMVGSGSSFKVIFGCRDRDSVSFRAFVVGIGIVVTF